ncbi:sensor histidine kinase [Actinomadura parmotrematis]|uniref:histidine kinase n=1 Tax=Actinomadura parmotrematis TaxID=2864039 RepID=A0ABS7FV45_9ACTN|nr:HAMP domain-containing sensor histidine kinase [Actinomadura parmotrematis]MBW8484166.1 HAMP domain-containing histidine kinase [Actinomadura parmotrematis]
MGGRGTRWRPSHWSLGRRITVTVTAIVGVLLAVGALAYYFLLDRALYEQIGRVGGEAARNVAAAAARPGLPRTLTPGERGFSLLQVVDENGRVVAASPAITGRPPLLDRRPARHDQMIRTVMDRPATGDKVYVVAVWAKTPSGWQTVYAGAPLPSFGQVQALFVATLLLFLPSVLILIGTAVGLGVRHALRPVRGMSAELARITGRGGDAGRRVTVPDGDDDVARLAGSINLTLRRLEGVMERQRGFVADVSHELRSPLAALFIQLEAALQDPEHEDWPAVARAALADADRLQRLVKDLLTMARLDAGVPIESEPVDLGALAAAEIGHRERRVPVEADLAPGIVVEASPGHLVQILTNLLDNAERHARSRVTVTVAAEEGGAVLRVADDGAGIAPQDRDRVFLRFQRLAESRERDRGGSGLGLPISRDLAAAHGGSLEIEDCGPGACLVLRLPLAAPVLE